MHDFNLQSETIESNKAKKGHGSGQLKSAPPILLFEKKKKNISTQIKRGGPIFYCVREKWSFF